MKYLGNIIFNIIFYISVVIASFIIIFLYPFISTISLQNIASLWVTAVLYLLKYLCGISWEVKGIENIKESPCILVSNHQGQWESFYLQTLLIPSSSIIKKELLFIFKIFRSFSPLTLSRDPWEIPILKMSNKQINGEIVKSLIINVNKEKILQNKKKINEN